MIMIGNDKDNDIMIMIMIMIIIIIIIIIIRWVSDIAVIRVSVVLNVLLLTITDFLKVWGKCAEIIEWETCRDDSIPLTLKELLVSNHLLKKLKKSALCVLLSFIRTSRELLRTQNKALFIKCNWLRLNWFRMQLWSKGCQLRKLCAPNRLISIDWHLLPLFTEVSRTHWEISVIIETWLTH